MDGDHIWNNDHSKDDVMVANFGMEFCVNHLAFAWITFIPLFKSLLEQTGCPAVRQTWVLGVCTSKHFFFAELKQNKAGNAEESLKDRKLD